MSILIKDTKVVTLQRAMILFCGHEVIELPDHGELLDKDELSRLVGESFDYFLARLGLKCPKAIIPEERSEASLCDNCDWKNEKGCSWCKRMERSEECGI